MIKFSEFILEGKEAPVVETEAVEVEEVSVETEVAEASGDKEAYTKFFNAKLKKYGVESADELEGDKKKQFFDEIDKEWEGDNEED